MLDLQTYNRVRLILTLICLCGLDYFRSQCIKLWQIHPYSNQHVWSQTMLDLTANNSVRFSHFLFFLYNSVRIVLIELPLLMGARFSSTDRQILQPLEISSSETASSRSLFQPTIGMSVGDVTPPTGRGNGHEVSIHN